MGSTIFAVGLLKKGQSDGPGLPATLEVGDEGISLRLMGERGSAGQDEATQSGVAAHGGRLIASFSWLQIERWTSTAETDRFTVHLAGPSLAKLAMETEQADAIAAEMLFFTTKKVEGLEKMDAEAPVYIDTAAAYSATCAAAARAGVRQLDAAARCEIVRAHATRMPWC